MRDYDEEPRDDEDNQFDTDVLLPTTCDEAVASPNIPDEYEDNRQEAEHPDVDSQGHGNGKNTVQPVMKPSSDEKNSDDHGAPLSASGEGGKATSVGPETNRREAECREVDEGAHFMGENGAQPEEEPRDDEDNPDDAAVLPPTACGTPGDQSGSFEDDKNDKEKRSPKKHPEDVNDEESIIISDAVSYKVDADDIDDAGDESLSFLCPICIGIAALVIVWGIRQFLPLIQAIAESSGGLRFVYLTMLFVPVVVIICAIWTAFRIFMRLPPGVNCNVADCVGEDGRLLEDKVNHLRTRLIKKYLPWFCRDNHLERLFGKKKSRKVKEKVECLCRSPEEDGYMQKTNDWLKVYKEFQDELKQRAEKIRDKYANAIALFTITSPKSQLDVIGTLFFSTRMLLGIARIFNKRMTRLGAFRLALSWAVHIYAIGEMQAIGAKVGGVLSTTIGMFIGLFTKASLGDTIGKVVDRAVSLGIEGGVNKKLTCLLGDKAIKEFVAVKGI